MRFLLGIILGCALTVGAVYVSDTSVASNGRTMVNWDVVSKNIDSLSAFARDSWKKVAG
jgi:hypothetical protein